MMTVILSTLASRTRLTSKIFPIAAAQDCEESKTLGFVVSSAPTGADDAYSHVTVFAQLKRLDAVFFQL